MEDPFVFKIGRTYESGGDASYLVLKQVNDILFCLTYSDRHSLFNFATVDLNEEWTEGLYESAWRDLSEYLAKMSHEDLASIT